MDIINIGLNQQRRWYNTISHQIFLSVVDISSQYDVMICCHFFERKAEAIKILRSSSCVIFKRQQCCGYSWYTVWSLKFWCFWEQILIVFSQTTKKSPNVRLNTLKTLQFQIEMFLPDILLHCEIEFANKSANNWWYIAVVSLSK